MRKSYEGKKEGNYKTYFWILVAGVVIYFLFGTSDDSEERIAPTNTPEPANSFFLYQEQSTVNKQNNYVSDDWLRECWENCDSEEYGYFCSICEYGEENRSNKSSTKPTQKCSSCYPTVCIPSPPPDLDCKDVIHKNFLVGECDPHWFDGDGDGIGCEPYN